MARHTKPYCLACGSERVSFVYQNENNDREVNEADILREVVPYLSRLAVLETKGSDPDDDSAHLALVGETIARTAWMMWVREEVEREEEKDGDEAQD